MFWDQKIYSKRNVVCTRYYCKLLQHLKINLKLTRKPTSSAGLCPGQVGSKWAGKSWFDIWWQTELKLRGATGRAPQPSWGIISPAHRTPARRNTWRQSVSSTITSVRRYPATCSSWSQAISLSCRSPAAGPRLSVINYYHLVHWENHKVTLSIPYGNYHNFTNLFLEVT